jgi:hypothetical protein
MQVASTSKVEIASNLLFLWCINAQICISDKEVPFVF